MDAPVAVPEITDVLIAKIYEANLAAGRKEKAFDTPFRYSDAAKCMRQMAFSSLDIEQTDPMDLAGHWVTWLGSLIHEKLQEALRERYPEAKIEGKSALVDLTSGHFDALITIPSGEKILYELKTKGTYGFDLAVGILRKQWKRADPEGPGLGAKVQGAMNAIAMGADRLIIGVIGFEAISKGFAEKIGCSEVDRIMGEWHYDRAEFEPWAMAELDRLREIKNILDSGLLPPRWGLDDEMGHVEFDAKANFPCGYCAWQKACQHAGPGPVALPIPGLRAATA